MPSASTGVIPDMQSTSPNSPPVPEPMAGHDGCCGSGDSPATNLSIPRASTGVILPSQSTSPCLIASGVDDGVGVGVVVGVGGSVDVGVGLAVGVGEPGAEAWTHSENSEVSPVDVFVAVAVMKLPGGAARGAWNKNAAFPDASVTTEVDPSTVLPSPNPESSHTSLEKNSMR